MYIYRMTPAAVRTENTKHKYIIFGRGKKASNQRREEAVREINIGAVRWKSKVKSKGENKTES